MAYGSFHDRVEDFRYVEQQEGVLQLLMDRPLLRYAGLWCPQVVTRIDEWPENDSWEALWACVRVDHKALADLADEPEGRAAFQITRLRTLKLIYPDGTRARMANLAIKKFMVRELGTPTEE
jgi:hypothetical protein